MNPLGTDRYNLSDNARRICKRTFKCYAVDVMSNDYRLHGRVKWDPILRWPLPQIGFRESIHYNDVIMSTMASQITSLTIDYPNVYPRHRSKKTLKVSVLAFVRGFHRWPVKSPHKGPVMRKMFPFDDVIMSYQKKWQCKIYPNLTHLVIHVLPRCDNFILMFVYTCYIWTHLFFKFHNIKGVKACAMK